MAKQATNTEAVPGGDSFLDVISNLVGILVILVMVVGARAARVPVSVPAAVEVPPPAPPAALIEAIGEETELLAENGSIDQQIKNVQGLIEARSSERTLLATGVELARQALAEERSKLDSISQEMLALSQDRWRLEQEEAALAEQLDVADQPQTKEVQTVRSYPTPVAHTVRGQEVHFMLKSGYLSWLPVDELVSMLKADFERQAWKLRHQTELSDRVGPVDGFEMDYVLERVDVSQVTQLETGQSGVVIQVAEWSLRPSGEHMGERMDRAVQDGSDLMARLQSLNPRRDTITLWLYEDSFEQYRPLREMLYQKGFNVATRPLPRYAKIAGSPKGSRSMAQ